MPYDTVSTLPAEEETAAFDPIANQKEVLVAALEKAKKLVAEEDFRKAYNLLYGICDIAAKTPELSMFPLEHAKEFIEISPMAAMNLLSEIVVKCAANDPEMQEFYKENTFPLLMDILKADPKENADHLSALIKSANGDKDMLSQIHNAVKPAIGEFIDAQNPEKIRAMFKKLAGYKANFVVMTQGVAMESSGNHERLFVLKPDGTSPLRLLFKGPADSKSETGSKMPMDALVGLTDGSLTTEEAKARVEEVAGKLTLVI